MVLKFVEKKISMIQWTPSKPANMGLGLRPDNDSVN